MRPIINYQDILGDTVSSTHHLASVLPLGDPGQRSMLFSSEMQFYYYNNYINYWEVFCTFSAKKTVTPQGCKPLGKLLYSPILSRSHVVFQYFKVKVKELQLFQVYQETNEICITTSLCYVKPHKREKKVETWMWGHTWESTFWPNHWLCTNQLYQSFIINHKLMRENRCFILSCVALCSRGRWWCRFGLFLDRLEGVITL